MSCNARRAQFQKSKNPWSDQGSEIGTFHNKHPDNGLFCYNSSSEFCPASPSPRLGSSDFATIYTTIIHIKMVESKSFRNSTSSAFRNHGDFQEALVSRSSRKTWRLIIRNTSKFSATTRAAWYQVFIHTVTRETELETLARNACSRRQPIIHILAYFFRSTFSYSRSSFRKQDHALISLPATNRRRLWLVLFHILYHCRQQPSGTASFQIFRIHTTWGVFPLHLPCHRPDNRIRLHLAR